MQIPDNHGFDGFARFVDLTRSKSMEKSNILKKYHQKPLFPCVKNILNYKNPAGIIPKPSELGGKK